jgi:DNA-binding NarL/FixJ family response regulator
MKRFKNSAISTLLQLIDFLQKDNKFIDSEELSIVLKALKSIYKNENIIDLLLHSMDSIKNSELQNKKSLTKREQEVLILIGKGLQNTHIASSLNLSKSTIETHRKNIRKKLKLNSSDSLFKFGLIFNLQNNVNTTKLL